MCRYKVNQHLILLNLDSFSINKTLVTEVITVKVSENLNLIKVCQHNEINNLVGTCFRK